MAADDNVHCAILSDGYACIAWQRVTRCTIHVTAREPDFAASLHRLRAIQDLAILGPTDGLGASVHVDVMLQARNARGGSVVHPHLEVDDMKGLRRIDRQDVVGAAETTASGGHIHGRSFDRDTLRIVGDGRRAACATIR